MKVTIVGYNEPFALNPDVSIYCQGVEIAKVGKGKQIVLEIDQPCELEFKCSLRSTKLTVAPDMCVLLSFNRTTGALVAVPTTEENLEAEKTNMSKKDNNKLVVTFVIAFILILFGLLLNSMIG